MRIEEQFIGFDYPSIMAGKKHLLYSEMELLTTLKKYGNYKKLRKEELALKELLKKSIIDIKKQMDIVIEYIPQVKVKDTSAEAIKITPGKRDALEEEIDRIRKKISMLSR